MIELIFNKSNYTLIYRSEEIQFLPKEFELLQFLYQHPNQTFSRNELLDYIWPMETPIDRTVDDHIYRLRKKLKKVNFIKIKTIRGLGYQFTINKQTYIENPSLNDKDLMEITNRLIKRYHLLGQGESMKTIIKNQEQLGIQINPKYSYFLKFINGEFEALLNTDDVPFNEQLYLLVTLYSYIHFDFHKSYYFLDNIMKLKILPDESQLELEVLDIIFALLLIKQEDIAFKQLEISHKIVKENNLTNFVIPLATIEAFANLVVVNYKEAKALIDKIEKMIKDTSYLREIGYYHIIKGLYDLTHHRKLEAEMSIDRGIEVLNQSQFIPLTIRAVHLIIYYLNEKSEHHDLRKKYERIWNNFAEQYNFDYLKIKLEQLFQEKLQIY